MHRGPLVSAIQLDSANFLLSVEGRAAVDTLRDANLDESRTLALLTELRQKLAPTHAGAVLTLARLRRRAAVKFADADRLFFTAEALEQATAEEVARHHAGWLDACAPPGAVLDLGCGIGGDLLALAERRPVIAYETDPVRARFARANLEARGIAGHVEVRTDDWTEALRRGALPAATGAFADPSRRVQEKRVFHLSQMQPPIAAFGGLRERVPLLGVKVMPSVADAELPANCGVESISHAGTCKEALLWFGPAARFRRWATVLLDHRVHTIPTDEETPPVGELDPGQVLYEPDPALIRAGCLATLCQRLGAHLFDPQIAYLVASTWKPEALAQAFVVDEVHPFSLHVLNTRLQALGVAQVELKKRGFPAEPEALRTRIKLAARGRQGVVIFTRRGDERLMLIGRRIGKVYDG